MGNSSDVLMPTLVAQLINQAILNAAVVSYWPTAEGLAIKLFSVNKNYTAYFIALSQMENIRYTSLSFLLLLVSINQKFRKPPVVSLLNK